MYLSCYELFQTLNGHSSPQDSSDSGEARVVPGGRDEKSQENVWVEEKKRGKGRNIEESEGQGEEEVVVRDHQEIVKVIDTFYIPDSHITKHQS